MRTAPDWLGVNGEYRFAIAAPPKPRGAKRLRVRVVDRGSVGAPAVRAAVTARGAEVRFEISAPVGQKVVVAKQVFVGWTPMPRSALPLHLRVRFDRVQIRRAMDPSCSVQQPACPAAAESTLLGQQADAPGEYQLYWDVAGIWGRWQPATLAARDGSVFPGRQTVDLYVARGRRWRLAMHARECDFGVLGSFGGQDVPLWPCPKTGELGNVVGDDSPGSLEAIHRGGGLGTHTVNAIVAGSTCPPANADGCYALTYTVRRVPR
jgi:hypothetical protein